MCRYSPENRQDGLPRVGHYHVVVTWVTAPIHYTTSCVPPALHCTVVTRWVVADDKPIYRYMYTHIDLAAIQLNSHILCVTRKT